MIKIAYVPEHFSTPLFLAQNEQLYPKNGLNIEFVPCPMGTGYMIQLLEQGLVDVAFGLTEAWSLGWSISTGENSEYDDVQQLKGSKIGVSRVGSGSYVMPFVLADQQGWLEQQQTPFDFVVKNNFANLRESVNSNETAAFMWEYFTSKKYYDNGEIRPIGEIYTPWSSWMTVASNKIIQEDPASVEKFLVCVQQGIKLFQENQESAIYHISSNLDYSAEDAREWSKTVRYPESVKDVSQDTIQNCIGILRKAGVISDNSKATAQDMIHQI